LIISDVVDLDPSILNVYPSVSDGQFIVEIEEKVSIESKVEIFNASGQLVNLFDHLERENVISVNNLSSGVYMVKYTNGDKSITKRISVIK